MKTPKKPRDTPPPSSMHFAANEESGEGLPYAPENWPEMGDIWGWRTGRRVTMNGTFVDRYLYLPLWLCPSSETPGGGSSRKRKLFRSKLTVERYIKENFPDADVNTFFASFTWKIPAVPSNGNVVPIAAIPLQQIAPVEKSDSEAVVVQCKGRVSASF